MLYIRAAVFAWQNRGLIGRAIFFVFCFLVLTPMLVFGAIVTVLPPARAAGAPAEPLPNSVVSQPFGCTGFWLEGPRADCSHFHTGIDLVAPAGAQVFAVLAGAVEVLPSGGYGLHVVVHHGDYGIDTLYAHLAAASVRDGEYVAAGAAIGLEGSSGMSTGPHLHFEVRVRNQPRDPAEIFPTLFATTSCCANRPPGTVPGGTQK
jgi:murein DD-endopeptidase MepM/ murein hydrolase activator NlpD